MHSAIEHLFYFVTARCNGSCKTCFNWRNAKAYDEASSLTLREIGSIARKMGRLKTLSISGGEPFLRDDLAGICKAFYEHTGFKAISIPTSGLCKRLSQVVDEVASFCADALVVIELPLDDVDGRCDEIRGAAGAFEAIKQAFFELKSLQKSRSNLHIKFNITYSYYNKERIHEILGSARQIFGAADFSLGLIHGEPRLPEAKNIDLKHYFGTLRQVARLYGASDRRDARSVLLRAIRAAANCELEDRLVNRRCSVKCLAGERFAVLSYNGDVYPCEPLSSLRLGNLKDFDFDLPKLLLDKRAQLEGIERTTCVCDWSCGISRSICSDKLLLLKALCRLGINALLRRSPSSRRAA